MQQLRQGADSAQRTLSNIRYGGTKEEMQRLIEDANKLGAAQGKSSDLTIDKFSDVVEAIHRVQENLDITGTTSREAATTIEGSVGAMKAAWSNWLTGLGREDADMGALSEQLATSIGTALKNVLPRIKAIAGGVVKAIPPLFGDLASLLPEPFQKAADMAGHAFDGLKGFLTPLQGAIAPVAGALAALGTAGLAPLMSNIPVVGGLLGGLAKPLGLLGGPIGMVTAAFAALVMQSPELQSLLGDTLKTAFELLKNAVEALAPSFDAVMTAVQSLIQAVMPLVEQTLATVIPALEPVIAMLLTSLVPVVQQVLDTVATVVNAITPMIVSLTPVVMEVVQSAIDLVLALTPVIQGVVAVVSWVVSQISGFITGVLIPVVQTILPAVRTAIETVSAVIRVIVGVVDGIINAVKAAIDGNWKGAWNIFKSTVSNAIGALGGILGTIKDKVLGALSGAGSWLYESGRNIVDGLIGGIKSMIGKAGDAIGGVMQKIRNFLPFSPAKEGPFSGHGWTPYSGRALVAGLAEGIDRAAGDATRAARRVMAGIRDEITADDMSVAMKTTAGTGLRSAVETARPGIARSTAGITGRGDTTNNTYNYTLTIDGTRVQADRRQSMLLAELVDSFAVTARSHA